MEVNARSILWKKTINGNSVENRGPPGTYSRKNSLFI